MGGRQVAIPDKKSTSRTSSILAIWVKMSALWPPDFSFLSRMASSCTGYLNSVCILDLPSTAPHSAQYIFFFGMQVLGSSLEGS